MFNGVVGNTFHLTINMCAHALSITRLQIPRFHTQVWYDTAAFEGRIKLCNLITVNQ